MAGLEVEETGLIGHPQLREAASKFFIPRSVITGFLLGSI